MDIAIFLYIFTSGRDTTSLMPCFLWGYLKSKVFFTPPPDIATLRQRIIDEFDALRHQAPMIRRAVREMEKRANLCVERNGGHVEGHGM